jgi:hypothetical protein
MVTRRPLPLLAAALAALLALAVAVAPAQAAKKKAPAERGLDATFAVDVAAGPGGSVPTTVGMTMWVPKGVRNAGDTMPYCEPLKIQAVGVAAACPQRSMMGSGSARGLIAFISQTAIEPMTLELINGPKNTLLAHIRGTNPVSIDVTIQSVITKPGGRYGMQLYFPFPDELIHPVPGSTASMLHTEARLRGKQGWLRSTSCPPTGWSLGAMLSNLDGGSTKISADLSCVATK